MGGPHLQAQVFVGRNARIGANCWLMPSVVVGTECILADRVRLLVLDGALDQIDAGVEIEQHVLACVGRRSERLALDQAGLRHDRASFDVDSDLEANSGSAHPAQA